jgi:hypothetical protein
MPRGDKSNYTEKQKRMAEHIEEGAEERGASEDEAERIAWATVNKYTGGALKKKSSSEIRRSKPEAKTRKPSPKRTGPAKTTGKTHEKLSRAGCRGRTERAEDRDKEAQRSKESFCQSSPQIASTKEKQKQRGFTALLGCQDRGLDSW